MFGPVKRIIQQKKTESPRNIEINNIKINTLSLEISVYSVIQRNESKVLHNTKVIGGAQTSES